MEYKYRMAKWLQVKVPLLFRSPVQTFCQTISGLKAQRAALWETWWLTQKNLLYEILHIDLFLVFIVPPFHFFVLFYSNRKH